MAAALVASTLANIHRDSRRRPYTVQDFMPGWGREPPRRQTPEETVRMIEMLNAAFGGRDLRHGHD